MPPASRSSRWTTTRARSGTTPAASAEPGALRDRLIAPRLDAFTELCQRAVGRGELPSGVDPTVLFDLLGGFLYLPVLRRVRPIDKETIRAAVDDALPGVGPMSRESLDC